MSPAERQARDEARAIMGDATRRPRKGPKRRGKVVEEIQKTMLKNYAPETIRKWANPVVGEWEKENPDEK
jgi:hypothetical protein